MLSRTCSLFDFDEQVIISLIFDLNIFCIYNILLTRFVDIVNNRIMIIICIVQSPGEYQILYDSNLSMARKSLPTSSSLPPQTRSASRNPSKTKALSTPARPQSSPIWSTRSPKPFWTTFGTTALSLKTQKRATSSEWSKPN